MAHPGTGLSSDSTGRTPIGRFTNGLRWQWA
jgi:hypothetical protein